ncbi:MAG TPA: tetratricopeptide repeat protein [Bacteroidia bacterium]|nr:tetratricopeptide repeat protein [Bacteroidia bacterium]
MRKLSSIQWMVISAAIICTVLLGFVSTTSPGGNSPTVMPQQVVAGHSLEEQVAAARKGMKTDVLATVNAVEGAINTNRDPVERVQMYDSLIRFLGRNKEYVYAAYLAEQKAAKNNGSGSDWQQAGERYSSSTGFQQDEQNLPALFEAAMRCFNKALELEPKNLDAKVGLGICIVQGTNDPMKGISTLLEVVAADSTNVNAQLALADFSVRRNAPDKAIARYSTALRLRPDYYGLHLNLAELYEQMGDTANAISHLEKYVQIETDPLAKNDVENAIRRLRAHLPSH